MNVVFISPHFPPQFFHFCAALKERGVKVLGLGDAPWHELTPALQGALAEYYRAYVDDYDQAYRALAYLAWRHGRIDRIDSHNEHWLALEARLREDFNIPGPRPPEMHQRRSKIGMAEAFRAAGIPHIEGERVTSPEQVRAFVRARGFPIVLKPDLGVGAARTYKVSTDAELEAALAMPLHDFIVQPFVAGNIVSYDGLVDGAGRIVFATSHAYSAGIMEVVNEQRDVSYWNVREIPSELARLGERSVSAFDIRERFFHIEFFELADGSYRALEVNIRPPGGFTTDMMNYSADIDVYRLWAAVIVGDRLDGFAYQRKYHVGYASRRWSIRYRHSHQELVARLGDRLLVHREVPRAFAGAMGDEMYLIRDADQRRMHEALAEIQLN